MRNFTEGELLNLLEDYHPEFSYVDTANVGAGKYDNRHMLCIAVCKSTGKYLGVPYVISYANGIQSVLLVC